mmetsp:Transcript_6956/g.11212  ORF Transcript_6956/g.11212 Transcript_6956/m.11212 type:complete len:446 (-) Transcript_6956:199-1536(-)
MEKASLTTCTTSTNKEHTPFLRFFRFCYFPRHKHIQKVLYVVSIARVIMFFLADDPPVLRAVHADLLHLPRHPQAHQLPDAPIAERGHQAHPRQLGQQGDEVGGQPVARAPVEHPGAPPRPLAGGAVGPLVVVRVGEEARQDRAEDARGQVHRDGVDHVVQLQPQQQLLGEVEGRRGQDPNDEGALPAHGGAPGADGHAAREDAVVRQLLVDEPFAPHAEEDGRDCARGRAERGHGHAAGHGAAVAGQRARGGAVEPEPAEPHEDGAQRLDDRVLLVHLVGGAVVVEAAGARAHEHGAHQRRQPARHVHHRGPRVVRQPAPEERVVRARRGPALAAPGPVHHHRIDYAGQPHRVQQVPVEGRALQQRARHDGVGGGGERPLEEPPGVLGAVVPLLAAEGEQGGAHHPASGITKCKTVPNPPEHHAANRTVKNILDQDILCVFQGN